jgi:hypothetical protein
MQRQKKNLFGIPTSMGEKKDSDDVLGAFELIESPLQILKRYFNLIYSSRSLYIYFIWERYMACILDLLYVCFFTNMHR